MDRLLNVVLAAGLMMPVCVLAGDPGRHDLAVGLDSGYAGTSGYDSWTQGAVGKLRYSDSGFVMSRSFLDYEGRIADTLTASVVLEGYDDDLGDAVDATEAYLEWRPVPSSATRYRLKVGAFYPRISLENVERGWGSPYTLNSSAINTWVAEELRSVGAELTAQLRPQSLGGDHEFSASGAVFWHNDPAGSLLAWKGWSVHDRQSRYNDKLPLPPLPQIQPGGLMETQEPYVRPFREIDGRAGYYLNLDWKIARRTLLRAMHYDNRADPRSIVSGQYGWRTRFNHVGVQTTLPGEIGLLAQWMDGLTVMGPRIGDAHVVDVEYDSFYLLLTRATGAHRVSLRYDNFDMSQNDSTPEDNNPEHGVAWTVAYRYELTENVNIAAEWLSIDTHRCGFAYYGLDQDVTERQAQLMVQLRF